MINLVLFNLVLFNLVIVINMATSFQSEGENFLAPGRYLVYIENQRPFADVEGYTHIARKVRDYIYNDKLWYDVILETDADGDRLLTPSPITISGDKVVSDRAFHDIQPRKMYHFAPLTNLPSSTEETSGIPELNVEGYGPIHARSFVIKSNLNSPLESTSRSALGSGIYGLYVEDINTLPSLRSDDNQAVYEIDATHAYPVQDKEHGESLTVASLNTNRYLDRIIYSLRDEPVNLSSALTRIQTNSSPTLYTLWNIVLYRTQDFIAKDTLDAILARYVVKYLTQDSLVDTINGEPLQELPINSILHELGYDGIIASDPYNNGWDRGCVSYNYSRAGIIQGEFARY